jgi:hypothetical protein
VFDRGLLFLVVANTGDRRAHSFRIKFHKPRCATASSSAAT